MRRPLTQFSLLPLLLACGGLALGSVYALSAYTLSPLAMPELIFLALVIVVGYIQPEAGLALTLMIIPAPTFGFDQQIVAYVVSGLSVYLALVAYRQRIALDGQVRIPPAAALLLLYALAALTSITEATHFGPASHLARSLFTGVMLFAATVFCVRDRRSLMWVLAGLSGGALLVGLHAAAEYGTGASTSSGFITSAGQVVGRATAGFSQPNQLGGFLVVLVPLALAGTAIARRGRTVFLAAALVAAIGVYASFSRGALIGLALVPLIFLRGWRLWLLGPIVALVAALAAPGIIQERFATLNSSGPAYSTRQDIWRAALNIWEQHPVIGVGLGGFPEAYSRARIPGKLFLPRSTFEPPPHAHDLWLQLLAEEGLFGALTFAALVIVSIRTTLRLRGDPDRLNRILGSALLAALIAFLAHNTVDVTIEDPQTGPYVLVLLGLIAAGGTFYGASAVDRARHASG